MIRGQTVGRGSGSKCDRGKVRLLAIKRRPADESNNFRAQDNPSHTAMATSPANASAIKYAVMSFSFALDQRCGMIACAIISGANPISIKWKPRADVDPGHAACRRVRACRPMNVDSRFPRKRRDARPEISALKGSDGSPLTTRRRCVGGCGAVTCEPPPDLKSPIEKARGQFPGAGF
jgi:hypothetical protein